MLLSLTLTVTFKENWSAFLLPVSRFSSPIKHSTHTETVEAL
jgi:hypothetical protein